MNERLTVGAEGERQDDFGVDGAGEFVALLGEAADVVLEIFTLLLLAIAEVPWVFGANVGAQEIADEDVVELGPAVDPARRQVL